MINLTDYIRSQPNPKELRKKLMADNPHCYWCGIKVRDDYDCYNRNLKKGEKFPNDAATIDHLYSRFDMRRYRVYPNHEDKVLACHRCNTKRAEQEILRKGKKFAQNREIRGRSRKKGTPRVLHFMRDLTEK